MTAVLMCVSTFDSRAAWRAPGSPSMHQLHQCSEVSLSSGARCRIVSSVQ